jgi:hypothetical protein
MFKFRREFRGQSSDVYAIIDQENGTTNGRLDIHFFPDGIIEGIVIYTEEINETDEMSLINQIDKELVPQASIEDEKFSITFVKSPDIKIYGKEAE